MYVIEIGDKAHQPSSFRFPQREFGKTSVVKRSFQRQWFARWPSKIETLPSVSLVSLLTKISSCRLSLAWSRPLFLPAFRTGKTLLPSLPSTKVAGVTKILCCRRLLFPLQQVMLAKCYLHSSQRSVWTDESVCLSCCQTLASSQGKALPFVVTVMTNFMRLIYLRSEDNAKLVDWIKQKTDKYTSGDMHNEMVKVMALRVLREIAGSLQSASFLTLMVDETTDVSNVEQVVICLRWVSEKFGVQEEFVGLYEVALTGADTIYAAITDVLLRLNLAILKVRGHCYDGAATMSGAKSGAATRLCAAEPRAVFTHCYGHSLNLACGDTIKRMQDALDTTHEITKLIKKSPARARDAIFKRLIVKTGNVPSAHRLVLLGVLYDIQYIVYKVTTKELIIK